MSTRPRQRESDPKRVILLWLRFYWNFVYVQDVNILWFSEFQSLKRFVSPFIGVRMRCQMLLTKIFQHVSLYNFLLTSQKILGGINPGTSHFEDTKKSYLMNTLWVTFDLSVNQLCYILKVDTKSLNLRSRLFLAYF